MTALMSNHENINKNQKTYNVKTKQKKHKV